MCLTAAILTSIKDTAGGVLSALALFCVAGYAVATVSRRFHGLVSWLLGFFLMPDEPLQPETETPPAPPVMGDDDAGITPPPTGEPPAGPGTP